MSIFVQDLLFTTYHYRKSSVPKVPSVKLISNRFEDLCSVIMDMLYKFVNIIMSSSDFTLTQMHEDDVVVASYSQKRWHKCNRNVVGDSHIKANIFQYCLQTLFINVLRVLPSRLLVVIAIFILSARQEVKLNQIKM